MSEPVKMLYLPKTMSNWPWPRKINLHYEEVSAESNAWFHGFKTLTKHSQDAFDKCDVGRLASLTYPSALHQEHLRTGCDLMNLFFVIDEYTDVESASVVREMVDVVIDALNNPHKERPEEEIVLGQVAKEFWELAITNASLASQKHFIESFTDHVNSIVLQAEDRDNNKICTIDEYLETRRENVGARPSFFIGELHLNLPDQAFYHPTVKEQEYLIADLLVLDNDIVSFNREQATGDVRHNILTIFMHQFSIDFDGAMKWVCEYHAEIEAKFLDIVKKVPSFGPEVDGELAEYIESIANSPRGNYCWSFEGGQYFGKRGFEIQTTRLVPLMPKIQRDTNLKTDHVVVSLVEL
ncbi:terpenoid synthase [Neolentinus lepideus HHB14362 ss-1]|uniref:Terpene synthase n=1 Tax=Neolentinus lepideus HHB14362 ss-1 TaxID=1314782 RepID=A0A165PSZ0_9AGAM|nr:terpenoid synthase [Neolentinus lepideus HHB14362 ss-1]